MLFIDGLNDLTTLGDVPMHAPRLPLVRIHRRPKLANIRALAGAWALKTLDIQELQSLPNLESLRGHPNLCKVEVNALPNMDLTALATCPKLSSESVRMLPWGCYNTKQERNRVEELKVALQRRPTNSKREERE
eukprot:comp13822_c0_seq1/m.9556 comp13822_c0_seq1/g.9556  ORF comp13822_c0_seq1/g.9556 comp13822_c0_seq1/m.9556 type:complete len:134 (-) comp13822_c0_seq1:622-1023(-)